MAERMCNVARTVKNYKTRTCVSFAAPGIDVCSIHAATMPATYAKCGDCGAWCTVRGSTLTGQSWICPDGHVTRRAPPERSNDEPVRREHLG